MDKLFWVCCVWIIGYRVCFVEKYVYSKVLVFISKSLFELWYKSVVVVLVGLFRYILVVVWLL